MNHHHNHHHQCHCHPTPTPTTTTTTCHCTICYTATHYPPPPPPPSDPLIHSISSHQYYHNPPQIHQHAPPQNHHNLHSDHHHHYPPPPPHQTHQNHHRNDQENPPPPNPTISSLIHRISALETSLRRRKQPSRSSSLRDAAARTIQTHFRAFLVRRSVTLRHLKDLAGIKSALNHLKSSVSNKPQFDSRIVSRESRNLLIKLESFQGGDPMIRDGKRAIRRELIRFMEEIDEICVESITVKNVRFGKNSKKSGSRVLGYDERKFLESLKNHRKNVDGVDESFDFEIPRQDLTKSQSKSQPKVKKNVRFDEDGNVYRLFKSKHNQVSSDGSDGDEEEVEEIGVCSKETEVEEDDSSTMSENEMDPRKNLRTRIHHTTKKNQPDEDDDDNEEEDEEDDDTFVFSAPLPAKMEY